MSQRASLDQRSTSPTSQPTPSSRESARVPDAQPPQDSFWAFDVISRSQSGATAPQPTIPRQNPSMSTSTQSNIPARAIGLASLRGGRPAQPGNSHIHAPCGMHRGSVTQPSSLSTSNPNLRPSHPPLGNLTRPTEFYPSSSRPTTTTTPPKRKPLTDPHNPTFMRGYNAGFEAGKAASVAEADQMHAEIDAQHQAYKEVLREIYAAREERDIEKMDAWIVRGWDSTGGNEGT